MKEIFDSAINQGIKAMSDAMNGIKEMKIAVPVTYFEFVVTKTRQSGLMDDLPGDKVTYLRNDNKWTASLFDNVKIFSSYKEAEKFVIDLCEKNHTGVFNILQNYKAKTVA